MKKSRAGHLRQKKVNVFALHRLARNVSTELCGHLLCGILPRSVKKYGQQISTNFPHIKVYLQNSRRH